MSKFKVGDKVKRVAGSSFGVIQGELYTVTSVKGSWIGVDNLDWHGDPVPLFESGFRLYKEESMGATLKENITRMEKELEEMKAKLEAEEKKNPYVGDKKVSLELTLDEWANIMAVYGDSNPITSNNSLDRNALLFYKVDSGKLGRISNTYPTYKKIADLVKENS